MFRKYILPIIALLGVIFAVYSVRANNKPVPAAPAVVQPAQAPFKSYIAGAGIVEASTENIAVGTNLSGVVTEVFVNVGSKVKKGDPLFRLDDREMRATIAVRQTALTTAKEKLARLMSMPRPEDIPPAEAKVREAESALADVKHQLALAESITDKRAISADDLNRRRYAVQVAEARLAEAKSNLALLKAGSWKPDIEIAKADIAAAEAQVKATETDIERLTVRSSISGEILQLNVRPGEYAQAGILSKPLILLGNLDKLHVRVDVDENEAWRFKQDSAALAFVRGNRELKTPIKFVRVEPYVVPKKSLTGDSTERVDTRVMQAIYSFDRSQLQVFVGQQMDVFIEAPPVTPAKGPAEGPGEGKSPKAAEKGGGRP